MALSRSRLLAGFGRRLLFGLGAVVSGLAIGAVAARADEPACCDEGGCEAKDKLAVGQEIFSREWMPGDSRSHGGDGLGPVFNDSSCVSCHNQGGPGGGGPGGKNVTIISAFANPQAMPVNASRPSLLGRVARSVIGLPEEPETRVVNKPAQPDPSELIKLHAGFRTARSVVLHHFGTDPAYDQWRAKLSGEDRFFGINGMADRGVAELERAKFRAQNGNNINLGAMQSQIGQFSLTTSQRNPTALFGSGAIDAIPAEVIEAGAGKTFADFPEISGRVSRLKDGRIGRFGWKAQTASLEDFVLTACAVELGLEVPNHPQAGVPQKPDYKSKGLDLTQGECNALTAYIAALPAPTSSVPATGPEAEAIKAGRASFEAIGCATCHTPDLGPAKGLYSDLLLHDMGPELGDTGSYGVFVPNSTEEEAPAEPLPPLANANDNEPTPQPGDKPLIGAKRQEWRTPPLWGVRDSGPYLHDGRAKTVDEAIALHGGQGTNPARRYFALEPQDRQKVEAFLKSLSAPSTELARAEK